MADRKVEGNRLCLRKALQWAWIKSKWNAIWNENKQLQNHTSLLSERKPRNAIEYIKHQIVIESYKNLSCLVPISTGMTTFCSLCTSIVQRSFYKHNRLCFCSHPDIYILNTMICSKEAMIPKPLPSSVSKWSKLWQRTTCSLLSKSELSEGWGSCHLHATSILVLTFSPSTSELPKLWHEFWDASKDLSHCN